MTHDDIREDVARRQQAVSTPSANQLPTEVYPLLEPLDEYNRQLLANVHPPGWTNPTPKDRYHLAVVGAGTAGLVSAAGAAGLGATVAIIERGLMGGDCLNVGCVPSKSVIRAARVWHDATTGHEEFGAPATSGPGDFGAAMARMRRLRSRLSTVDGAPRFASLGVDVFLGHGRFVARDAIEVDGRRLRFRRAVITTGARAAAPSIPGLEEVPYLTNETIFNLTTLPPRLVVIGGGPIGCEMAQCFARFGSAVTLVDRGDRILPRDEPEAASVVYAAMERDGVRFRHRAETIRVTRHGGEYVVTIKSADQEEDLGADQLLIAVGRAPNIEGLGLDRAGVEHHERGVAVDDHLRTTNPRIFAAGDVCSQLQFTHTADFQARIVIQNALFASTLRLGYAKATRLVVPWCTYTVPELAHVGLDPAGAAKAGIAIDTVIVSLHDVDRAVLDGEEDGLLRVHLRRGTDHIVGATLVASHAGDLISELTLAITNKVPLGRIGNTIHPYPTQADVMRKAADAWRRTKLTPRARAILERYFRLLR